MCYNHYPHSYQLFTKFIDYHTLKYIEVCFNCEYDFGYEPYEKTYVCKNEDFKNKKIIIL